VVPSATAVVTLGAALAEVVPLPESDNAFWALAVGRPRYLLLPPRPVVPAEPSPQS
jgi:hypothetical protein